MRRGIACGLRGHAIGLLCHPEVGPDDLPAVAEVLWESSRHSRSSESLAWLGVRSTDLEVFREEVAAFLVLRDLSPSPVSPHLDTLLRVKLPLTTFDPEPLGAFTAQLTDRAQGLGAMVEPTP